MVIVEKFPKPPALVEHALAQVRIAGSGDLDAITQLGDVSGLARPWEPATCDDQLRHHLWQWCDEVVAWLNKQYTWRTTQVVPACWPWHPHIANELPLLACQRVIAGRSFSPDLLDEWHRHCLPEFLDRLALRLGESTCRVGKHVDWPAAARHQAAQGGAAVAARHDLFFTDTHPPTQLRPTGTRTN